MGGKHEHVSGN